MVPLMFPYKPYVSRALEALGFQELTEVQTRVIPAALSGRDLMVTSETGSGKTHAYLIPLFERLVEEDKSLQFVISSPTRELARQIAAFAQQIAEFSSVPIDIRVFTGGTDRPEEMAKLRKQMPQIVIGTPGKLRDLTIKENLLDVHRVRTYVVDEADMTLDEGFLEDIDRVASRMPETLQTLVFSATLPEKIQPFLRKYLRNPEFIDIAGRNSTSLQIAHYFIKTKGRPREEVLGKLLPNLRPYFCIVFCNTKETAENVYRQMADGGYQVGLLHGGLEARKRRQVLAAVRELRYQYLVTTDLLSRGIDIPDISHIINYDLPRDWEFYVHRTGRTGRMDKNGVAISLYDYDNDDYLNLLEARGLKTVYKEIGREGLIDAKVRGARGKRPTIISDSAKQAIAVLPKPKKDQVKPGYKKKYQEQVKSLAKTYSGKRGK